MYIFFLSLRGHLPRMSTHSAVLEAMTGRSLTLGYELLHCEKLTGAITTLSYAQLYNYLKSVDMLKKCKRLSRAFMYSCSPTQMLSTLPSKPNSWRPCAIWPQNECHSMPHDKFRKHYRIFLLWEWSMEHKLRPLVRTSFHLPLQPKANTLPACPYPLAVLQGAALRVGWQAQALKAPLCQACSLRGAAHPGTSQQQQQQQHTSFPMQAEKNAPYTNSLEGWLLAAFAGVFLLFMSQEENIATQTHSTVSRVFSCLDRIVHLAEASTCNEQPVYWEIW